MLSFIGSLDDLDFWLSTGTSAAARKSPSPAVASDAASADTGKKKGKSGKGKKSSSGGVSPAPPVVAAVSDVVDEPKGAVEEGGEEGAGKKARKGEKVSEWRRREGRDWRRQHGGKGEKMSMYVERGRDWGEKEGGWRGGGREAVRYIPPCAESQEGQERQEVQEQRSCCSCGQGGTTTCPVRGRSRAARSGNGN